MVTEARRYHPTKFTRFVIYPVLFVLFSIALVFVLFLANGYRFNFTNGQFLIKKTGMIILNSRPTDAQIILDGKDNKKRTGFTFLPIKIDNIIPGKHNVVVKKDGFRTWSNNIVIKPNLVSWLNYILLFPVDLKLKPVDNLANKTILAESRNHRFLLVSGNEENIPTLYTYDLASGNLTKIWPKTTVPVQEWLVHPEIITAEFSQGNDKILLNVKTPAGTDWAILEINNSAGKITSLSTLSVPISKVQWNLTNSNEFFVQSNQNLYRYGVSSLTNGSLVATKVIDFTSEKNGKIYYVANENTTRSLYSMDPDGNRKELISKALPNDTSYKISYSQKLDGVAVLPLADKTLTVYYKLQNKISSTELSRDIKNFLWSPDGQNILYYNDNQIKSYNWEKEEETVANQDTKIVKVDWYFDERHFLVRAENSLYEIDYDNSNKVIFSDTAVSSSHFDPKLSSFVFVKNEGGKNNIYKYSASF